MLVILFRYVLRTGNIMAKNLKYKDMLLAYFIFITVKTF